MNASYVAVSETFVSPIDSNTGLTAVPNDVINSPEEGIGIMLPLPHQGLPKISHRL